MKKVFSVLVMTSLLISSFLMPISFAGSNYTEKVLENIYAIPQAIEFIDEDNQVLPVYASDKLGLINIKGDFIVPMEYDVFSGVTDGLLALKKDDKFGYLDMQGNVVIPFEYEEATPYIGLKVSLVKKDGKYGYIDNSGNTVIPFEYDGVSKYSSKEGATIKKADKWGYIDTKGNIIVPFEYDGGKYIEQGIAIVKKAEKWGCVNLENKVIVPFEYNNIEIYKSGIIKLMKEYGEVGFADNTGKIIVPLGNYSFESSMAFDNGNILLFNENEGNVKIVDKNGKDIFDTNMEMVINIKGHSNDNRQFVLLSSFSDKAPMIIDDNGKSFELPNLKGKWLSYGRCSNDVFNIQFAVEAVTSGSGTAYFDINGKELLVVNNYNSTPFINGYALGNDDVLGKLVVIQSDVFKTESNEKIVSKKQSKNEAKKPVVNNSPSDWAKSLVEKAINAGLIPEKFQNDYTSAITREQFCELAIKMMEVKYGTNIEAILAQRGLEMPSADTFEDCTNKSVLAAKVLGITGGTSENMFSPNAELTREQAAVFLTATAKICGADTSAKSPKFADIKKIAKWARPFIGYVNQAKIMGGVGDNKFDPQSLYQRQQAFITIYNLFETLK